MGRHFFFRPSILIALSAAVVVGAVVVVFQGPPTQGRPAPLPVRAGEQEIVCLYQATEAASWERFVAAVRRTADLLQPYRRQVRIDDKSAFPQQTTTVPEVSLSWSGPKPRFVFRWYKLTGDWKARDWIEALLARQPPPLAVIGGSSSESARELAVYLHNFAEKRQLDAKDRPLLLLTSATADRVAPYSEGEAAPLTLPSPPAGGEDKKIIPSPPGGGEDKKIIPSPPGGGEDKKIIPSPPAGGEDKKIIPSPPGGGEGRVRGTDEGVPLTQLYPGRTFRFCFTNKQMATAVSDFIWGRDDLRPTRDPVYMAQWNDDSYSRDLIDGFSGALRQVVARDLANQWAWTTSQALFGVWPPGRGGGIFPVQRLRVDPLYPLSASSFSLEIPPAPYRIDSSVGSFDTPNPYEARVAGEMLDHCLANWQPRPLLIVAGQAEPSRRFLRGLVRGVPALSKSVEIVVATGDAISFNTVYRDGHVAWNIQDLPFPLVFFCHRNPIDASAGFRAASGQGGADERDSMAQTGTEDVLLFGDIVEALVQTGAPAEGTPCANAAELAERLAEARREDGRIVCGGTGVRLFDRDGQRRNGTGEHVVCLQPVWNEDFKDRLLPRATIEVWAWRRREWGRGERGQHWQRRGEPLTVWYSQTH